MAGRIIRVDWKEIDRYLKQRQSPPVGPEVIQKLCAEVPVFVRYTSGLRLRSYQEAAAQAIVLSVLKEEGLTFVVMFPRQSGKNELQAQIETYLLTLLSGTDAEIVKVSPTWKPQTLNAMRRLERVLERNLITRALKWLKESGYIYRVGSARIFFLSGSPTANVVGATASTLLECDEAQDVLPSKWDKDFAPMAASTNATRVFWGTAWTSRTLLARELRAAREAERQDGRRRVFVLTAEDVAKEVPAYGEFVAGEIQKLGRNHPMVRTQFFSEEIDAEGGMFPPARRSLMQGDHPRREGPEPGKVYALLLDVAGEDEGAAGLEAGLETALSNEKRDATALTIVEVDLSGLSDDLVRAPVYRVVDRRLWVGVKHTAIYGQLLALAEAWGAAKVVVDATGVGAGLASFLDRALPGKVIPFVFNGSTKSKLGWDFLAVVETGRFKDWREPQSGEGTTESAERTERKKGGAWPSPDTRKPQSTQRAQREKSCGASPGQPAYDDERGLFWQQVEYCQMEVIPGPERRLRWAVPDGTRDGATGELVHDDLLLSAALCAVLDGEAWTVRGPALVVPRADPLKEIDSEGF